MIYDTATDEAARMFTDHLRALAMGALPKTVEELTESEKFAICFYAGVKTTSSMDMITGRMNWKTEPVAITKIGDKFNVAVFAHQRVR